MENKPTPNPDSVRIRPLGPMDAANVMELEESIFGSEAWSKEQIEEELSSSWSQYVGVEIDGRLLGYAGVKGDLELDVMTIGVLPEARGLGLGKALLQALLSIADGRTLFLEVRESNVAALGLYRAAGFRTIGRIKGYYRDPSEDAVTMSR